MLFFYFSKEMIEDKMNNALYSKSRKCVDIFFKINQMMKMEIHQFVGCSIEMPQK